MCISLAFCSEYKRPFFQAVQAGVLEEVDACENVYLRQWGESYTVPLSSLDLLNVDGVVAGILPGEGLENGLKKIPMVGCSNSKPVCSWPRIVNDDEAAGFMAAEALANGGYDRLLLVEAMGGRNITDRMKGVKAYAKAYGIPIDTTACYMQQPGEGDTPDTVWLKHHNQLRECLRDVPDNCGIVVPSCTQAMKIFEILQQELGRDVPGEIGLVMVDLPTEAQTSLAHVRLAGREIGRRCTRQLLARLRNPGYTPVNIEYVKPEGVTPAKTLRVDEVTNLFAKLNQWCHANFAEDVQVEDMARVAALSRRSLEMKLREAGLPPPHQILTDHRMREARRRLQHGSCCIEELADACGYRSARAFSKMFTACHGMSPMKWKRQKRRAANGT